jgi:hypothetical protein
VPLKLCISLSFLHVSSLQFCLFFCPLAVLWIPAPCSHSSPFVGPQVSLHCGSMRLQSLGHADLTSAGSFYTPVLFPSLSLYLFPSLPTPCMFTLHLLRQLLPAYTAFFPSSTVPFPLCRVATWFLGTHTRVRYHLVHTLVVFRRSSLDALLSIRCKIDYVSKRITLNDSSFR